MLFGSTGTLCVKLVVSCCWSHVVCCIFSQLFGEEDADQEVSPDTADPEAACEWPQDLFNNLYRKLPPFTACLPHGVMVYRTRLSGKQVKILDHPCTVFCKQGILKRRQLEPPPLKRTETSNEFPPKNGPDQPDTTQSKSSTRYQPLASAGQRCFCSNEFRQAVENKEHELNVKSSANKCLFKLAEHRSDVFTGLSWNWLQYIFCNS